MRMPDKTAHPLRGRFIIYFVCVKCTRSKRGVGALLVLYGPVRSPLIVESISYSQHQIIGIFELAQLVAHMQEQMTCDIGLES